MKPKDWTLLVLTATKGHSLSPVQLQKALFLIGENLHPKGFYTFSAYDYGPFCSEVYVDAEELEAEGLASITRTAPRTYREYFATALGARRAAEIRKQTPPGALQYLDHVVEWILPLSFDALVRAIYRRYPAMRANSVFKDS